MSDINKLNPQPSSTNPNTSGGKPEIRPVFPRWLNYLLPMVVIALVGSALYVPAVVTLAFSPIATDSGYAPDQPVPYSHALHVGQLGMDCRYCHTTVEHAGFAAVPPTQTCMNCHTNVKPESNKLQAVQESWKSGKPVEWVKIHDLPDYSYFNHSAHVNKGVGCTSCHGQVDQMEVVYQAQPLNMAWCLDCHRQPEKNLRPVEQVTNMNWKATDDQRVKDKGIKDPHEAQLFLGNLLKQQYQIKGEEFMTSCSTCHR